MVSIETTKGAVRSADGTTIAFERAGRGPALVMVDAAMGYSGFRAMEPLPELLANQFTVFTYDRRGRGRSGDTPPYDVEREVEDLAAVITEAGGSAFVYGFSSGALLALQAASHRLAIPKLALFEPPIGTESDRSSSPDPMVAELNELVAAGRRWDATELFHTSIGVPGEMIAQTEPGTRRALEAVAHTIVYDFAVSDATTLGTVASVRQPTLVIDSEGSTGDLTGWAKAVNDALPNGTHRSLAGEWHGVPPEDLAPVLAEFFTG